MSMAKNRKTGKVFQLQQFIDIHELQQVCQVYKKIKKKYVMKKKNKKQKQNIHTC